MNTKEAIDPPWDQGPCDKNFEEAFSDHISGCRSRCECGREFWDSYNSGYDWEEGEREQLEANLNATGLEYAVGFVSFEGRQFVNACDCWHARARKIIGFLQYHDEAIADFLSREKRRKESEANRSPVVA